MDSCLKLIRLWFGFSFLVTERFFHSFGVLFRIMGDRLNLMSARYRWISFRKCWVIQEFNELLIMETLSSSLFFTNQLASIQYHACATHKPYCMKIHSHSCRCKPCSMGAQIHHRNKLWIFPRAHRAHLIIAQLSSTTVFTSLYTNAKKISACKQCFNSLQTWKCSKNTEPNPSFFFNATLHLLPHNKNH